MLSLSKIKSNLSEEVSGMVHRKRSFGFRTRSTRLADTAREDVHRNLYSDYPGDEETDAVAARAKANAFHRRYLSQLSMSMALTFGI